ncbi:Shikimate dehydrogenase (NADP(+)) [uncultured archaeon]|nr:Shikimate dehydrogenase (NADP(+)) [uncultured archaeon]
MKIFGIFGDPIEHSLSPAMQNAALRALGIDACYHAFRVSLERLEDALLGARAMGFCGLNLTIPLKEKALEMDFLQPDPLCAAIGAVNTISFSRDGKVTGHNTDGWGALSAMQHAGLEFNGSNVLMIGAGGAARAIAYTLAEEGARISIANRNAQRAQSLAAQVGRRASGHDICDLERLAGQADIIINATSVGMHEGDRRLFDGRLLNSRQAVFDIVYNRETELLSDARAAGIVAIDGVMMLVYQGAKALEIWTGKKAPVNVMERAVREGLRARGAG